MVVMLDRVVINGFGVTVFSVNEVGRREKVVGESLSLDDLCMETDVSSTSVDVDSSELIDV